jgi:polyisoprenoid-binding protein YceI
MARALLNLATILVFSASALAQVEVWNIDPAHSAAQFAVRHMGISTVRGSFTKLSGVVRYDQNDPTKTTIEATIESGSVDTRVDMRDKDLRGPNFLDVDKYPTLTFKSRQTEAAGAGKLRVTGDLTIHGVTKEVVLDVDGPTAPVKDPRGNLHMGASATTKISRKDFGVSGAAMMVGDEVSIVLDVELAKPAQQKSE